MMNPQRRPFYINSKDTGLCQRDSDIPRAHYNGVIMSSMAFQITSLTIVYLTIYSGTDKKKTSKLRVTSLLWGINRCIPCTNITRKMAIWWRHHETAILVTNNSDTAYGVGNFGNTSALVPWWLSSLTLPPGVRVLNTSWAIHFFTLSHFWTLLLCSRCVKMT